MSAFTAPEEATRSEAPDRAGEVRAFYESHPYPAPLKSLDQHRELYRNPDRRRALSLLLWPTAKQRTHRKILVAGCGTSQAAAHAMREPDALVTGIDISVTSISHTRDLQRKYNLRNLVLHRLAIEEIGQLGQTFDEIVCTGVLHHMPDPDVGLRALRCVLAPDGAMHVMVYGTYGRAGIYMIREYCRLLWVRATDQELRDLGALIGALSDNHPIAAVARQSPTRSPTHCSIPRIAPTLCPSFMPGSSDADCRSGAGSSRRPICRSAGRSPASRMSPVSSRCRRPRSTRRWSFCAGP